MTFGQDAHFSDEAFLARFNADLANDLGNTVSRVAALLRQSFGGTPPEACESNEILSAFSAAREDWRAAMEDFAFSRALEAVWRFLTQINGYVVAREPWKVRKEEGSSPRLARILYAAAEGVRLSAVLLSPFIPDTSRKIFETFGLPAADPRLEDLQWGRLPTGARVPESGPLFPRADAEIYFESKGGFSAKAEVAPMDQPTGKPKDVTLPLETTQAVSPSDNRIDLDEFKKVRLVTARILAAERVPKSKKLVKLEVDIGTERRQIVAGIATRYEPEALVGRNVVIVANLKPATLMGVESNGMVLAATVGEAGDPSLLEVSADVPPGSRVK
jgi:methionyl-tRNA synthetase